MRKRMMILAAVAVFAITLTACGAAQTSNTPTSTAEPTKEVEATTAPTIEPTATNVPEPTATPEPTSTPTPEPTAAPEPTNTPTPGPTEAPTAETKDWETVLRELHSLETYEEREEYVAKLDQSAYKAEQTESFALINEDNSGEVEVSNGQGIVVGYKLISELSFETVEEYTVDNLPAEYRDAFENIGYLEHDSYGPCFFEEVYEYETITVNAKAALDVYVPMFCDTVGNYDDEYEAVYLMTLTNIATGETDPWGIVSLENGWDWDWETTEPKNQTYIVEVIIRNYNGCIEMLSDPDWAMEQVLYHYANENGALHSIETWDTLKYYEDLVSLFQAPIEEW